MPTDTARLRARLGLLAWLVLAGTFFGLTFGFDEASGTFAWGAAAWPRAVLVLMVVAAIANDLAKRPNGSTAADAPEGGARSTGRGGMLNVIGMIAIPLVYLWLIPRAGFYASTLAFVPAFMLHLGERRWTFLVGVTLFLFAVINLVFTRLFFVALPTGSWPVFYDLSNWFVTFVRM